MGALESCAELASKLRDLVSPSKYELNWSQFPKGISDIAYIERGLGPAFDRASRVYATLDLPPLTPGEVGSAWKKFLDGSLRVQSGYSGWRSTVAALVPGIGLPASMAYEVTSSVYGGLITALYYTSASGALGHIALKDASTQQFSIHKMVIDGQITEATAMAHAGWAYSGFSLISVLDELGLLRPLKKSGVSGLGAVPVVAIIVGVLVLACIIAAAVVLSKNLSEVNALQAKVVEKKLEVMADACKSATDPKIIQQCASGPTKDDLTGGSLANGINDAIKNATADLAKYLAIGLGAYLLIQLLPSIIGKAKESAKVAAT